MPSRFTHVLFALALGAPLAVRAQPVALPTLAWDAPAVCPDREQVRATLQRWLDKAVDAVDARSLRVSARVRSAGNDLSLTLLLESPSGRAVEQFSAERCDTLLEVVGLKVTLAASASAALQALGATAVSVPAAVSGVPDGGGGALQPGMRAAAGVTSAMLPGLAGRVELTAVLGYAWVRLELGVSYAPPRAASYPSLPNLGANFQLASAEARACAVAALGMGQLPICAGMELGALIGTGFGPQQSFSRAELYGAVVFGPALRWPLTRVLAAWVELDGSLAFARPEFRTRGAGSSLYQPPVLGSRALIGFELSF